MESIKVRTIILDPGTLKILQTLSGHIVKISFSESSFISLLQSTPLT